MNSFFILVVLAGLALSEDAPTETNSNTTLPTTLSKDTFVAQEFIACVESGECGLSSICAFRFERRHSFHLDKTSGRIKHKAEGIGANVNDLPECPDTGTDASGDEDDEVVDGELIQKWLTIAHNKNVPKDKAFVRGETYKAPTTNERETSGECKKIIEGHIFAVENRISNPILFYWDISDVFKEVATHGNPIKADGAIYVPAGTTRYFIDSVYKTHTIRLLIADQFVGEAIAKSQTRCKEMDACDFLYRLCYQYKEDQRKYKKWMEEVSDGDMDYYCDLYTEECDQYAAKRIDREKCIGTCLQTYFPETVKTVSASIRKHNSQMVKWMKKNGHLDEASPEEIKSDATIIPSSYVTECLLETPDYVQYKDTKNTMMSLTTSSTDSLSSGWIVAIVLISVIAFIAVLLLLCWSPYCEGFTVRNKLYNLVNSKKTEVVPHYQ